MAPHSSTLAWKIPWTVEPGRQQSMGSLRVGHNWVTSLSLFTFMHWRRQWHPTPVLLPGKSHGPGRLQSIGSLRVGHDWATSIVTKQDSVQKYCYSPKFSGKWDMKSFQLDQRPVAYFSKQLNSMALRWPSCLQAVAATALLVNEASKFTLRQHLDELTPHQVQSVLEVKGRHWLTGGKLRSQAFLMDTLNIALKVCQTQ